MSERATGTIPLRERERVDSERESGSFYACLDRDSPLYGLPAPISSYMGHGGQGTLSGLITVQKGLGQVTLWKSGEEFLEVSPVVPVSKVDTLVEEDIIQDIGREAL